MSEKENYQRRIMRSFFLITAFLLYSFGAVAQETITWAIPDFPPFYFVSGEDKGKGATDYFLDLMIAHLPEYQHKKVEMNFARYTAQATAGDKICLANLLKQPEREKIMHYSIAMGLGLPQRLIMKPETARSLGIIGTTELSLIELFKNPNLKVSFEKGRAYQNIDPIIQEGASKYKHVGINVIPSDRSFRMMQLDRISYIVEYPYQANLMAKKLSLQIITFKIKEHVPFIEAFVTCAKTDFGLQVINKVSQFIRANKATPEYRKMTTSMSKYLDENTFTSLMELRETVFIRDK